MLNMVQDLNRETWTEDTDFRVINGLAVIVVQVNPAGNNPQTDRTLVNADM